MRTLVRQLRPGDAFRVDMGKYAPLDYRLIYVNECRAYVEPLAKKRDILDENSSSSGRVNITPNCECEIIDEGLEVMMKSNTTTTSTTAKTPAAKKQPGERRHDPKKSTRPVREGTIRAKLLAAIKSGKSDVNKLMKEFSMTRPVFAAHVNEFWRCHGYGYSIIGNVVKLVEPVGGVMKADATKAHALKPKSKKQSDPLDDEDPLA